MKIKRIVVPVDFSANSMRALDFAADLAKPFGAELVALFAVEPLVNMMPDYGGAQTSAVAELLEEQRRSGSAELARIEKRYRRRGIKLRTLMATGRSSEVIADTAKRLNADLVVMATHGRTGVSRLLMGSVTQKVVRAAPCPVLTLHAGDMSGARRRAGRHGVALVGSKTPKIRAGSRR